MTSQASYANFLSDSNFILPVLSLALYLAVGGGVGYAIGQTKGRGTAGFWLGLLFGIIGWIIVGLMGNTFAHDLERHIAIQEAMRGSGADSTTQPNGSGDRGGAQGRDHYWKILAVGDEEARGADVGRLVDALRSRGDSHLVSSWLLVDGGFGLVVRQAGKTLAVSPSGIKDLGLRPDVGYDATADGTPTTIYLDGAVLTRPRPEASARRFLRESSATQRSTVESSPTAAALPAEGAATAVAESPRSSPAASQALAELEDLRSGGLITEVEHEAKRAEILRRL